MKIIDIVMVLSLLAVIASIWFPPMHMPALGFVSFAFFGSAIVRMVDYLMRTTNEVNNG